ncbi:hypothetical protein EYF80_012117 [Liparis tanakae]|uniref:Uncharacterized protein n=1 Tax=Liparis tanakae TaxID=230148 RepID=A0A4Z2IID3_9TELE|nr:hypothetical protein EYF80_012117 [Liparis tanakae]
MRLVACLQLTARGASSAPRRERQDSTSLTCSGTQVSNFILSLRLVVARVFQRMEFNPQETEGKSDQDWNKEHLVTLESFKKNTRQPAEDEWGGEGLQVRRA